MLAYIVRPQTLRVNQSCPFTDVAPRPYDGEMKSPFSGIVPPELAEVPSVTVWPTIGALPAGRLVGRLADVRLGWGEWFTLGKLAAVATIPFSLGVFCWQLMPYVCRRYTLTNRRIIIRRGLLPADERWIGLDEFDAVEVEILPGQQWLHAGDVLFKRGANEVFRLAGVSRPEVFRQMCLTAQQAMLSVRDALRHESQGAA